LLVSVDVQEGAVVTIDSNSNAKKLRNTWGSTTTDGAIHLSINLLKAPDDIIGYMISLTYYVKYVILELGVIRTDFGI